MAPSARLPLLVLAGALVLLAMASAARADTAVVTIQGSKYNPQTIDVHVGDTIRWDNNDGASHTATAQGNAWDTGTISGNGGEGSVTMQAAGTFSYFCKFHSSMTGTVRVLTAASQNEAPTVTFLFPVTGSTVSGIVELRGEVADANAADALSASVRFDGGVWRPATIADGQWSFSWDTRLVPNGVHTVSARVTDGKASATTPAISLTVNNLPTIEMLEPQEGDVLQIGDLLGVVGTASAAPGSVLTVEVSIQGGPWSPVVGRTSWSFGWDTSGATPGVHTVQARAMDGVNTVLSQTRNVTIIEPPPPALDEPPVLSLLTPGEGAIVSGLVNISGTATDDSGPPLVQVNVAQAGWRNVTGRAGSAWWYHWIPEGHPAGSVLVEVRARDASSTSSILRHVRLSASPPPLEVILPEEAREGRPTPVELRSADGRNAPLGGARMILLDADGARVQEVVTDAAGRAELLPVPAGAYTLRAYAPGAFRSVLVDVKPRFEVLVTPTTIDYDRLQPVTVHVAAEEPVVGLPVQLRGAILPGGESPLVTTGRGGNASFAPLPLAAGELEVWVNGNDTGQRVRIVPIVLATWSPDTPAPFVPVTLRLTLNDLAFTPAAGARVVLDLPGEGRRNETADAQGEVRLTPQAPGTMWARIEMPNVRTTVHAHSVRAPPAEAELHDVAVRAGAGVVEAGVRVRNAGSLPESFIVDALTVSRVGPAAHDVKRTSELAPGAAELVVFRIPVGAGEYELTLSVRNSTATVTRSVNVALDGIPPAITPVHDLSVPEPQEAETPGVAALGALAALGAAALARRKRR